MHSCCRFRSAPMVQWETCWLYSAVGSRVCSNGLWTLVGFDLSPAGMDKGRCHVHHLQGAPRLCSRPRLPCSTMCAPTLDAGEAKLGADEAEMREGHDRHMAVIKTGGGRKGIERRRVDGLSCGDAYRSYRYALCEYITLYNTVVHTWAIPNQDVSVIDRLQFIFL